VSEEHAASICRVKEQAIKKKNRRREVLSRAGSRILISGSLWLLSYIADGLVTWPVIRILMSRHGGKCEAVPCIKTVR
jgi:hypothetical protein